MSLHFPLRVAKRYLGSRRSEAFITIITVISVLGVAIGVMVINMVMAIMTGFEMELRDKIVGTDSHIIVRGLGGKITEWQGLRDTIRTVEGVRSVAAFTYNQALVRAEGAASGILIRGIEEGSETARTLGRYIEGGAAVDVLFKPAPIIEDRTTETHLATIIVGRELLRNTGAAVGMPVALLSPQVGSTPLGLVPRFRRFVIAASYASGFTEYEGGLAYMSLLEAQQFFRMGDAVSGIEVRVNDIDQTAQIASQIMDRIGESAKGLYVQDWTQTNKPLWEALRLEKKVYFIVLLLIVVMASISIVSTLILLVMEKRGDIAIFRTLGATASEVGNIFRIQGAIIGVGGTFVGTVLGLLGCWGLQFYGFPLDERIFGFATLPLRIEPQNFMVVAIAAFGICFAATIYPAYRASKLDPADVLRHE
jgi:lipoprotein-releasing system permease protein